MYLAQQAYTHQCLTKNHPVLFKMYETYLDLPESNYNYIQAKIKQKYDSVKCVHMREKVDIVIYVAMYFWKRSKHHKV